MGYKVREGARIFGVEGVFGTTATLKQCGAAPFASSSSASEKKEGVRTKERERNEREGERERGMYHSGIAAQEAAEQVRTIARSHDGGGYVPSKPLV